MSNSAEVAIVGKEQTPPRLLSDDQRAAFWDGILRHREAARRMAGKFVSRQNVDDVVDTAAVRFIEALERPDKPERFPATDDHFRRWFLFIVRNLRSCLPHLSPMQRQIVDETFFKGRKRAAVADRLGISVKTYDVHLQKAFCSLRHLLFQDALSSNEVDRSTWYDLIEELRERYDSASVLRVARKKGKRSTVQHERSKSEGERSNVPRKSGTGGSAGAA